MAADTHGRRAFKRWMEKEGRDDALADDAARHSVSFFSFVSYRALTKPLRRLAVIDQYVWIFNNVDRYPGTYFY